MIIFNTFPQGSDIIPITSLYNYNLYFFINDRHSKIF